MRRRTPPGSRSTSPGSGTPGPASPGRRSSTTQAPSSSSAETCSPQVQPCRCTSSADGSVALVFTTSRSPGSSHSGSSRACRWWVRSWVTTASRTSSRARPRASGGAVASLPGGSTNLASAAAAVMPTPARCRGQQLRRAVAAAGQRTLQEPEQRRYGGRRLRAVGDVLAGERVLVHLGAHVARVDGVHAQRGLLGRQHPGRVVEPGLGRAVAAPGLVGLDRRVRRQVEDRAAVRGGAGAAAPRSAPSGRPG